MLVGEFEKTHLDKQSNYAIYRMQKHAAIHEKNISLFEINGRNMGKKTIKEKPPLELQFDHVKDKVTGWEKYRTAGSQIGPWVMLLSGALIATVGFFGIYLWWQNHDWNQCRNHWYPDYYYCMDLVREAFKGSEGC